MNDYGTMIFIIEIKALLSDSEKELGIIFDRQCKFSAVYGKIARYNTKMGKKCGELDNRASHLCGNLNTLKLSETGERNFIPKKL